MEIQEPVTIVAKKRNCRECSVVLTDREWDEGNGDICASCEMWHLHDRIRRLEKWAADMGFAP